MQRRMIDSFMVHNIIIPSDTNLNIRHPRGQSQIGHTYKSTPRSLMSPIPLSFSFIPSPLSSRCRTHITQDAIIDIRQQGPYTRIHNTRQTTTMVRAGMRTIEVANAAEIRPHGANFHQIGREEVDACAVGSVKRLACAGKVRICAEVDTALAREAFGKGVRGGVVVGVGVAVFGSGGVFGRGVGKGSAGCEGEDREDGDGG